jgi:hypothetical protein
MIRSRCRRAGHRHGCAAVLLGHCEAENAELLHLIDPALGVVVGVLDVADGRLDFAIDEPPHGGD